MSTELTTDNVQEVIADGLVEIGAERDEIAPDATFETLDVDSLDLPTYHAWHATRADLLRRLHRYDESRTAYDEASRLAGNDAEKRFLEQRRDGLPT